MERKMFAFDMDGTILNDDLQIVPATIAAIKQAKSKNHLVVVATGRPYQDAMRDLAKIVDYLDYIVCNNGAYFYSVKQNEFTYKSKIDQNLAKKIWKIALQNQAFVAIHGNTKAERAILGNLKIDWESPEFWEYKIFKDRLILTKDLEKWMFNQRIHQISFVPIYKYLPNLLAKFQILANEINIHVANSYYIDLNPKETTKWIGLQDILVTENLNLKNVVTFGDSGNDLDMLAKAGKSFCMQNGVEAAKNVAQEVIGSNNSDAIAKTILKLI